MKNLSHLRDAEIQQGMLVQPSASFKEVLDQTIEYPLPWRLGVRTSPYLVRVLVTTKDGRGGMLSYHIQNLDVWFPD